MRILRSYFRLPPLHGGLEIHLAEISLHQAKKHEVTLAFSAGNEVKGTTSWRILPDVNWFNTRIPPLKAAIFYLVLLTRLVRSQTKFDVIHLHGDWSTFIFGSLFRKISPHSRLMLSFHGALQDTFWHKHMLPFTIKNSDLLICTGYEPYSKLSKFCHAIYQPSGVRDTFYSNVIQGAQGPIKRCVTTSIFRKKKQTDTLLYLATEIPEMEFVFIGDGPEKETLSQMAAEKHLQNVQFKGFLSPSEIMKLYENSDVFLHSSFFEGTPTSVMEAMAAGLPIIAAHAPGLEQVCRHEINGILISHDAANQEKSFLDAVLYLNDHPQIRQSMSAQNRLDSQKFSWQSVSDRIERELQTLLHEQTP